MPNYPIIKNRKMKYSQSPSGYVFIGKYIPPFENNASGFGFKGVLMEDFKSGKIQCAECGEWFEQIHHFHLANHGITGSEYKKRYGLLQSTALKSKKLRLVHSKVMQNLRAKYKQCNYKFERNNVYAGNRKDKPKALEHQNKYGVCDLQVLDRIKELAQELGKTPTLTQLSERYGAGMMPLIHNRYGSYIKLLKENGITPNFSNFNPKYSREYFIEKFKDVEPSHRLLTINEGRALYRFFKSIKELKNIVKQKHD